MRTAPVSKMRSRYCANEDSVWAGLFSLIWQKLRSAASYLTSIPSRNTTVPDRIERAHALQLAAMCVMARKGEVTAEEILAQADEFLQYMTGDDEASIPRPDKRARGRLPKP